MKCLFLICIIPIVSHSQLRLEHGTTLIAIIKDDTTWIAADTKIGNINGDVASGNELPSFQGHKICQTKSVFYAFTYLPIVYRKDKIIFNAYDILSEVIKKENNFNKCFEQFNAIILRRLDALLDSFYVNKYDKIIQVSTQNPLLAFIMIKYINGKPHYKSQSYKAQINSMGKPKAITADSLVSGNSGGTILFLGEKDDIYDYLQNNPDYFKGFNQIKERLVCLINIEATKHPLSVGMPCDIVAIYKNGRKFYYGNKNCTISE